MPNDAMGVALGDLTEAMVALENENEQLKADLAKCQKALASSKSKKAKAEKEEG